MTRKTMDQGNDAEAVTPTDVGYQPPVLGARAELASVTLFTCVTNPDTGEIVCA